MPHAQHTRYRFHAALGLSLLCLLALPTTTASAQKADSEEPAEVWKGTLKAGPQEIEMQFRVFEPSPGKRTAMLDVISQGANGLPATVTRDQNQITFEIELVKSKYDGTLNESGDQISGHWHQSGLKLPFDLTKADKATSEVDQWKSRSQYPKPPFPYDSVEVKVENVTDRVTLAGTMTIPKSGDRFPAVILISGSGPQDRDETLLGHKPFAVIADHLSRNGIAVLRLDDRGVGESTGTFNDATTEDFSRDAEAAFEFLRNHEKISSEHIGLVGHSEGGLIAPIVAARRDEVGFIVLLAGPGINGAEIIRRQSELIARAEGIPESIIELNGKIFDRAFAAVAASSPGDNLDQEMDRITTELIDELPEEQKATALPMKKQMVSQLQAMTVPWFKFFLSHEPIPTLQKVQCPTLAMIGEKDLQVPAKVNLDAIRDGLKHGASKDFEVVELKGLNHLFQTAETGSPTEYVKIDETIAPAALNKLTEWIQSKTN